MNFTQPKESKYRKVYRGVVIDAYRIFDLYEIENGAHQHAIKKLLRAGHGSKPLQQDVRESIECLERLLEMLKEDE